MRRLLVTLPLVLSLAVALAGCGGGSGDGGGDGGGGNAEASCVGPYLDDQPPTGTFGAPAPTVAPGTAVTIYGHWYAATCNDHGTFGETPDPVEPLAPVRLTLTLPDGTSQSLGTFTPSGADLGFSTSVEIPAGTGGGEATITDDRSGPASYTFTVAG